MRHTPGAAVLCQTTMPRATNGRGECTYRKHRPKQRKSNEGEHRAETEPRPVLSLNKLIDLVFGVTESLSAAWNSACR
jgi:hypothetical protein